MEQIKYDVVIAGAGPSGCAAAIALKLAGVSVCLVDREQTQGRKVGESVPGAVVRLLNRLGINGINDLLNSKDYNRCFANASSWGSEEWTYNSGLNNPEGGGYHINRIAFDESLRERAVSASVVMYNAMVDSITPLSASEKIDGFEIRFKYSDTDTITAKWVIDATGRKAAISRKFGFKRERLDSQMAAISWIKASESDNDYATRIKSVSDGWWYTSLLPDKSRVIGFQGLPKIVTGLHKNPELFFKKFNKAAILNYEAREICSLHKIAVEAGVARAEAFSTKGLICVGDAALSFDPLSSQGIFFALYSGIKGAETILNCLDNNINTQLLLEDYNIAIDRVFIENQKSLRYFYSSEPRYVNEPYWKSQINSHFKKAIEKQGVF